MCSGTILDTDLSYEVLKAKHRKGRDQIPENLSVRVHRGLSWLKRAEMEVADDDAAFIFYWIAFNASYAEVEPGGPSKNVRNSFEKYFKISSTLILIKEFTRQSGRGFRAPFE